MNYYGTPSIKSIERLKEYVKNVSAPYQKLVEYENQLIKNGKTRRALARICNGDSTKLINKLEGTSAKNWYTVSNMANLEDIPAGYFDIILWSDCDLESELRQLIYINDKLRPGGRVYFNNLLTDFNTVIKNCIPAAELEKIYGVTDPAKLRDYPQIVRSILQSILKDEHVDVYSTQLLTLNDEVYLVFIKKGVIRFEPSAELSAELADIDKIVAKKIPTAQIEPQEIDNNEIFAQVTDLLLADKKVTKKLGLTVSDEHLEKIIETIEKLNENIDILLSEGVLSYEEIIAKLPDILDLNIANTDHWNKYIQAYLEKIMEEEPEISETAEEYYPDIKEPESGMTSGVFLQGLRNIGGYSCFMDSLLFTILLPSNGYFNDNLLTKEITLKDVEVCTFFKDQKDNGLKYLSEFQKELQKLAKIIRGRQNPDLTCYPIVQQMKKCGPIAQELMSGEQQDDSEFLTVLMQIFNLEPTTVNIKRSVSEDNSNWITTSDRDEKLSILEVQLPEETENEYELVEWYQNINITNYQNVAINEWPQGPDAAAKRYQYSSEKYTIKESELLIFHVSRIRFIYEKGIKMKNKTLVSFENYIHDKKTEVYYELTIVSIHYGAAEGGHYTAYFKHGSQWYYYDDTLPANSRVRAVTLDEVYQQGKQNGSLFFYKRIYQ